MKITRTINGKTIEIELTPEEIEAAYWEHEKRNIYDNVERNIEFYLDDDLLADNEDFMNDVAKEVQYQMAYGFTSTFEAALECAVKKYIGDYLQCTQAGKSNQN